MAEPRDRLATPEDIVTVFERQRRLIRENRIYVDERERSGGSVLESPALRRTGVGMLATPRIGMARRRKFGRGGRGRGVYGSVGRENVVVGGSGGRRRGMGSGSRSVLPSWYPRTPLRDITHVVRAIERRRAYLRDREGEQDDSPLPAAPSLDDPSSSSTALLEHDPSLVTPLPLAGRKQLTSGKLPKILLDVTNQNSEESELLTPQKKLLNSIDTVEKVVMEELQRQKRTPSARKAERDKRILQLFDTNGALEQQICLYLPNYYVLESVVAASRASHKELRALKLLYSMSKTTASGLKDWRYLNSSSNPLIDRADLQHNLQ